MKTLHEKEIAVLKKNGAKNIEPYCLVNNYGYHFEIDGVKYDARFWKNCYGCELYLWRCDGNSKIEKELQRIYLED